MTRRYEPYRGLALWGADEEQAGLEVLKSRSLFRYYGPDLLGRTEQFEAEFARHSGADHVVGVSSGTAALACALVGLGLPAGAEVVIPAVTFVGCVNAVIWARGVPVLADIDQSLTIDPASLEAVISDRTFAVMPVHLANVASDMDAVMTVASRAGLKVVEDCAQAAGVAYRGHRVGGIGDVGTFSFQLEKNMTAGEGGAVSTSDPDVHSRIQRYQDQGGQFTTSLGQTRGEAAAEPFAGVNLRMTELTAAVLRVQATRLDPMLERLRSVASRIRAEVVSAPNWRTLPDEQGSGGDVTMLMESRMQARQLVADLTASGVPARVPYAGQTVASNPSVRDGRTPWGVDFKPMRRMRDSEAIVGRAVTVDLGARMTDDDVSWVVAQTEQSLSRLS